MINVMTVLFTDSGRLDISCITQDAKPVTQEEIKEFINFLHKLVNKPVEDEKKIIVPELKLV